ncbi:MAG: hypothetical protein IJC76_04855 [Lachnospiraceae bacterium]|nr:hypothetical protein [Lachnospiraceae bacterium]
MNKKIIFVMIIMVAILANSIFTFAVGNVSKNNSDKYANSEFDIDSEILENQYKASENYAKIMEYVEGGLAVNRESREYYGGAYINE